jgi:hypothetical protein
LGGEKVNNQMAINHIDALLANLRVAIAMRKAQHVAYDDLEHEVHVLEARRMHYMHA